MVTNVTRTPNPLHRTFGGIHLAERVDMAAKAIPEGAPEREGIFRPHGFRA